MVNKNLLLFSNFYIIFYVNKTSVVWWKRKKIQFPFFFVNIDRKRYDDDDVDVNRLLFYFSFNQSFFNSLKKKRFPFVDLATSLWFVWINLHFYKTSVISHHRYHHHHVNRKRNWRNDLKIFEKKKLFKFCFNFKFFFLHIIHYIFSLLLCIECVCVCVWVGEI